ncbi:sensor histidine kinase [Ilumatobacter sp.]|uniref:sensor histidine kinase n=1 Tax=Ilumatobacter sp. TaxID=1967498 RepID=UPI003B51925B
MYVAVAVALLAGAVIGFLLAARRPLGAPSGRAGVVVREGRDGARRAATSISSPGGGERHVGEPGGGGSRGGGLGDGARESASVVVHGEESDSSVDDIGTVLRLAINEFELGVVVSAPDGRVIYRNRAASAMHGTHAGVLVEDHVERALDTARLGADVDRVVDLHGPPAQNLRLVATSMPNGLAVATIEDVSARVRLDAMRTDFVANLSHELKTPVGAVAVLSEALSGETDPVVVERVAARLVAEAHRAVHAIDDLLELARIESATDTSQEVDLGGVVADAIARGRGLEDAHEVTVSAFLGRRPPRLRADRRQLVSAIGNLVENAVKYSEPGGLVQVRTHTTDRVVEVMVADQGIGIPARDLDRVFERFYRVDRARSRRTGGTGLGLSIVRHVASNHGGEVVVSSTEGEGSTFVLRLPIELVVGGSDPDGGADPDADPPIGAMVDPGIDAPRDPSRGAAGDPTVDRGRP